MAIFLKRRNPYYAGPRSAEFDGLRFRAPVQGRDKSLAETYQLLFRTERAAWPVHFPSPFRDRPPERVDDLRVTLIGHASFLIQIAGRNILVDPVWSERASPFRRWGPKRVNPPGIAWEDLPPIDLVLITHNHYDHLDRHTLVALHDRYQPRIIAPLGNDTIIRRFGDDLAVEAYGWDVCVDCGAGLRVHLRPAYHWSARGLFDKRMAQWCAYVLQSDAGTVYHIGDTAYGDGEIFRAVAREFGPPRLALIPIGAYEPRWFMKDVHVCPEESVQIMLDCGARQAVGHHWGTFQLTAEPIDEPAQRLAAALAAARIAPERFPSFRPGQVLVPDNQPVQALAARAFPLGPGSPARGR
ncbi:MBL fold metallo-hydrolase [Rhodoligotrophos defluvii]|uniref:MBL fold metallo-hydrolase n=1 Tax=Rhodoligotrophos defluvii TaxID=2561934 RepID=UPI0010C9DBBD|nr:MBL fold metallo-hydrolase [Rhodoligotrophos defluvii]